MEALEALVRSYGAHARPVREVIAALTEGAWTLAALVQATAVPRRTVEDVLAALGADLATDGRILPERAGAYRERFGYDQLRRTSVPDPVTARLDKDLCVALEDLVARAPASRRALDHVAATPETAAWRGTWLDSRYDLAGARLLCVGDHDLTSLAAALVNPELAVTVVDLDERILEYIDTEARARGLDVTCLYADLRLGLPASATASADLVFTDPPYTAEGVRLFLARGAEGLRDRDQGRLVMAYGYSDRTPALGLKVQQSVQELGLVFEAILPAVNRYAGAQAVGSASDVYVCRPTARTWKGLEKATAVNIYTHGPQSLEGAVPEPVDFLDSPVTAVVGANWPQDAAPTRVRLETVLAGGLPASAKDSIAVDLSADPGPWLLRTLLAVNAAHVSLLVPNNHPDLASEAGQRALAGLVAGKYSLRYRRSTPGPAHAVVVAEAVSPARGLLDRAHGRVGNVWREALIRASAVPMTKNEARAAVRAATSRPELLERSLVELPRHQLVTLLAEVAVSGV